MLDYLKGCQFLKSHYLRNKDVAKLKHKVGAGNLVDENEKQQLQRWELVRGELESGNDNISLKKEAKKLISYFMKSGRLSKSEAYDLLIQLSL